VTGGDTGRRFLLLGHPVGHSLSPRLQEAGFQALGIEAVYEARDLPPETSAEEFALVLAELAAEGVAGLNVTSPFKAFAHGAAAAHTPAALATGAVNCLRLEAGGYEGTNTDGAGFLDFAAAVGLPLAGSRVVLLGAGGSAAGLAPALGSAGSLVEVVARRPERTPAYVGLAAVPVHAWGSPAAAQALAGARLVVNCTTLGAAAGDELACAPAAMSPGAAAVDLRYAPRVTPWLRAVAASGRAAYDGLGLLVFQGAHSLRFWLGVEPPLYRLREAVRWDPVPIRRGAM
jgi:shikimate dehydrogenase